MNKVILFGNLGADPELRVTPGGTAVLKLRLATTESFKDKQNTWKERTEWHQITVWGKRGESLAKILHKGSKVLVEGSLRTSSYEKDGEKRYRTEINALDVRLGDRKPGAGQGPFTSGGRSNPEPFAEGQSLGEQGDAWLPPDDGSEVDF